MSIKSMPSMEHTFLVKIKGSDTGQLWEGSFTYKRPNIRIETQIDKTKAILDGGIPGLSADTQFLHEVLSTLKHTLIDYPKWFEDSDFGYELYDANVIFDIFKQIKTFEKEWKDNIYIEDQEVEEEDVQEPSLKQASKKASTKRVAKKEK